MLDYLVSLFGALFVLLLLCGDDTPRFSTGLIVILVLLVPLIALIGLFSLIAG